LTPQVWAVARWIKTVGFLYGARVITENSIDRRNAREMVGEFRWNWKGKDLRRAVSSESKGKKLIAEIDSDCIIYGLRKWHISHHEIVQMLISCNNRFCSKIQTAINVINGVSRIGGTVNGLLLCLFGYNE
jgi:hypothetical protein